jgi:hypothetical protein
VAWLTFCTRFEPELKTAFWLMPPLKSVAICAFKRPLSEGTSFSVHAAILASPGAKGGTGIRVNALLPGPKRRQVFSMVWRRREGKKLFLPVLPVRYHLNVWATQTRRPRGLVPRLENVQAVVEQTCAILGGVIPVIREGI